jgi:hypothetical protein
MGHVTLSTSSWFEGLAPVDSGGGGRSNMPEDYSARPVGGQLKNHPDVRACRQPVLWGTGDTSFGPDSWAPGGMPTSQDLLTLNTCADGFCLQIVVERVVPHLAAPT